VPLPNPERYTGIQGAESLYDASQGRNGGGNVNADSKVRDERVSRRRYEYFRNDILNANEYFPERGGPEATFVKQNIFEAV